MAYKNKTTQREYQRNWVANRRSIFLKDKCCAICGAENDLQLDHIDPDTKKDHRIWSWSQSRIREELMKCQILCLPCHQLKTHADNNWSTHGPAAYRAGCRCDKCILYKKQTNRSYYQQVIKTKREKMLRMS